MRRAQELLAERAASTNPASFYKYLIESQKIELETYDAAKAEALFARFKKNHTWQCPTLVVLRNMTRLGDPAPPEDPRLKYLPRTLREFWVPNKDSTRPKPPAETTALEKRYFQKEVELLGAMNRAGVGILAGTDTGNPFCFPGFSLHDELGLLVEASLTPMQALQAATRNAARFMGREKDLGTVQPGRLADLVLLDANPLEDIHNTKKINTVIFNGRVFPRAALEGMLSAIEKLAAEDKPPR